MKYDRVENNGIPVTPKSSSARLVAAAVCVASGPSALAAIRSACRPRAMISLFVYFSELSLVHVLGNICNGS